MPSEDKTRKNNKTISPALSIPEIRFCQLYASDGISATQAFLKAGFATQPASESAANNRAWRLLRRQEIREYIQDLRDAACAAAKVSVESLARGFAGAVDADITAIFGPNGEARPPSEWPVSLKRHITAVEVEDVYDWQDDGNGKKERVRVGQKWKIKTENKTENRKILAQWKKMLTPDKGEEMPDEGRSGAAEVLAELASLLDARIAEGHPGQALPAAAVDSDPRPAEGGVSQ